MLQNIQLTIPSFKLALLILAAVAYRFGLRPPNPPPSRNDNIYYKGPLFENIVRASSTFSQISVITCLLTECAVLLSYTLPTLHFSSLASTLCPHPSRSVSALSTLSPTFVFGASVMLSAAVLRVWCFSTLGSFFTYEVTIKPDHKLITSGPYAYVRHPGYTGGVLILTGAAITCLAPGGYITECQILATPARWWVYFWILFATYACISLLRRGPIEDERLRREFKDTWDKYSRAVRYRFVPGLL